MDAWEEIERAQAVLYEAAGELDLANVAQMKATSLNPDLAF